MKIKLRSLIFLAALLLPGCLQDKAPLNLTIAKERVAHYYESGQYKEDLNKIVTKAMKYFDRIDATGKSTIIFDIDDTLLTNYFAQKEISFGHVPKLSHEWVKRADAPVIEEMKKLYDYCVDRGFKIVLLTGRRYDEYDATVKNLKHQGIEKFEKLIVREKDELIITAEEYKSDHRKKLTEECYEIVGCIGDQESDLAGEYSGHEVKLPNYIYTIR